MRLSGLLVTLPLLALSAAQQQPAGVAQPAAADQPAAANPAAAQPAAAQPAAAQPAAAQPAAANPAAAQPAAANPAVAQPAAANPAVANPAVANPAVANPAAANPAAAQPPAANPAVANPAVPNPAAANPVPGVPAPSQQAGGQPVGSEAGTHPEAIVGTWSTKSNQTLTGPGFYDSVNDQLIEPSHTGISYSFTADGFYETAYYRAVANPQDPSCPKGILQWQHGSWERLSNGSLTLTPIPSDGRELFSNPCLYKTGIYRHFNQSEKFQRFSVYVDPYHGIPRLDLYKFDGSPMNPMFIAFKPPMMVPTTTLHPTSTPTASGGSKRKRSTDVDPPVDWRIILADTKGGDLVHHINADRLWWLGLAMTGLGGLLYLGPRRMGFQL